MPPADNTAALTEATRRRSAEARTRAEKAVTAAHRSTTPVSVAGIAKSAGVSRSWLYTQTDLMSAIRQIQQRQPAPTRTGPRSSLRWWREVLYIVLVYLGYSAVRNQFGSGAGATVDADPAFHHAEAIIQIERNLHLYFEHRLQNWYLDLANERDVGDDRFVSIDELKTLREDVRHLDPGRLVTASTGGHDLTESDVRDALRVARLDSRLPDARRRRTRSHLRHRGVDGLDLHAHRNIRRREASADRFGQARHLQPV